MEHAQSLPNPGKSAPHAPHRSGGRAGLLVLVLLFAGCPNPRPRDILYSSSRGQSDWVPRGNPGENSQADYRAIWASSPKDIYVADADGSWGGLIHTSNQGKHWEAIRVDSSMLRDPLLDVWGSDAQHIFAVGPRGVIFARRGDTWAEQPSGTDRELRGVWGSSADDVYVVGDSIILHTTDGGRHWKTSLENRDISFQKVWASSPTDVYAASYQGIFHSADRGRTWQKQVDGYFEVVWGLSAGDVLAGGAKVLLHTRDGGRTWRKLPLADDLHVMSLWGTSMNNLYALVGGSHLYRSGDGGQTWQRIFSSPADTVHNAVWGTPQGELYLVGSRPSSSYPGHWHLN